MKVAIIHDWIVVEGGAEKVLAEILAIYPDADLFTTVFFLPENQRGFLNGKVPKTSFIQKMPFARKHYRKYISLMPIAVEQFDLSGYDLVISSSYAVAKGVITGPNQVHVSYVHSPARYAWDMQHQYLKEARLERGLGSLYARWVFHKFRIWDTRTAHGVDHWIANSRFVARRIKKVYGVEADVINPPVDTGRFTPEMNKQDYYLTASRLVPYKRIPLIAAAFSAMPDKKLVVIGDGPEMAALKENAGPNVTVLGYQSNAVMVEHMRNAKAFVFAAEEDFGIVPLEAQACGTPVIGLGKGGLLETVIDGKTGVFFKTQDVPAIIEAVERFERDGVTATQDDYQRHVDGFSISAFRKKFTDFVNSRLPGDG